MSGGLAYLLDERDDLTTQVNSQMVVLEALDAPEELATVRAMIERHFAYTASERAGRLLADWERNASRLVKVTPRDYQRMLTCLARARVRGLGGDEAVMTAFEENARDLARVGGT